MTVGFTWLSPADEAASAPLDVGEVLDSKKCERNQADARDAWNMVGWKGQRRMEKKNLSQFFVRIERDHLEELQSAGL